MLISRRAWNLLKVHCKVFNWFYFYYWYNCRRHSKIVSVNLFSCDCSRWHCSDSVRVYTENYTGCMEDISVLWEKHEKAPFNFTWDKKPNYSLVCSNLSQSISTRRKHYFKHVRTLTEKKKCCQNRVQNACLFLNNRFVHFASEIDTGFSNISWY